MQLMCWYTQFQNVRLDLQVILQSDIGTGSEFCVCMVVHTSYRYPLDLSVNSCQVPHDRTLQCHKSQLFRGLCFTLMMLVVKFYRRRRNRTQFLVAVHRVQMMWVIKDAGCGLDLPFSIRGKDKIFLFSTDCHRGPPSALLYWCGWGGGGGCRRMSKLTTQPYVTLMSRTHGALRHVSCVSLLRGVWVQWQFYHYQTGVRKHLVQLRAIG
jgi:hypothetical protein